MNINDPILTLDEEYVSKLWGDIADAPPITDGLSERVVKEEVQKPKEPLYEPPSPSRQTVVDMADFSNDSHPRLTGDDNITINTSPFLIGKSRSCNFTISGDTFISRKHCRITKEMNGYFIEDLNSTNGTFVDGVSINRKTKLENGQEITLADRRYQWAE